MRSKELWLVLASLTVVAGVIALAGGAAAHRSAVARPLLVAVPQAKARVSPLPTSQCLATIGIHCYSPGQFEKAYNLAGLHAAGIDGRGETIAIVDSFGSPTIAERPARVRPGILESASGSGIPADPAIAQDPNLTIIAPAGAIPPFDPTNDDMVGWAEETTLDVEWAHVMAPKANILLVETPVSETEGVTGLPGDRQGRELRHRPSPRERDLAELRRDRGDVPEHADPTEPPDRVPERAEATTSPCSARRATPARPTSSSTSRTSTRCR